MDEAERANRVAFMAHGSIFSSGTPAELKEAMAGDVLAVTSVDRAAVRRILRSEETVKSIEIFGDEIHVLVASAQISMPKIQAKLAQAGLHGAQLRSIAPSLEDAFVARLAS
jgi:ABC-type multidrug transport system ATPase subunit